MPWDGVSAFSTPFLWDITHRSCISKAFLKSRKARPAKVGQHQRDLGNPKEKDKGKMLSHVPAHAAPEVKSQ